MDNHENQLQVRTFAKQEEIWNLEGFQPNNGVNSQNYERIVGDYCFQNEVKCCFLKPNGNLCGEDHKWGFVARLIDASITIVGNNCAIEKFGADSKMTADRARYLNEKIRREAIADLSDLVATKNESLSALDSAFAKVKELKSQVGDFINKLGAAVSHRLQDMCRTGNSSITVRGISYREYVDEGGVKCWEPKPRTQHNIYQLKGLKCLSSTIFADHARQILTIKSAFAEAEQLLDSGAISIAKVKEVIAQIKMQDQMHGLLNTLESDVSALLKNDLLYLCFLTTEKTERYKLAQLALAQRGQEVGKDRAKSWLAEEEIKLSRLLGVEKVEVE